MASSTASASDFGPLMNRSGKRQLDSFAQTLYFGFFDSYFGL
jgi:hypothetical protein